MSEYTKQRRLPKADPPIPAVIEFTVERHGASMQMEIDGKHALKNVPWPSPVLLWMLHGGKLIITRKS